MGKEIKSRCDFDLERTTAQGHVHYITNRGSYIILFLCMHVCVCLCMRANRKTINKTENTSKYVESIHQFDILIGLGELLVALYVECVFWSTEHGKYNIN